MSTTTMICEQCGQKLPEGTNETACAVCLLGEALDPIETRPETVEGETVAHEAPVIPEGPGTEIGPYKILQKIGEGGFGVVFMAEQRAPLERRVALKVIKPGMDSRSVIARFEAERQALAIMDHPNIAKVFDAGTTETGRPYFAMELVKGIPVTKFCDEEKYDTTRRLELFREICSAVNHAHQKGIIHRDLKPSNILVGLDGDKPVAKIIDFGIAKATQQKLTEKTLFTRFEQFVGTPLYTSPEQSAISAVDIDTRSDIYSLGVLLYELLAGKPPFDAKTLLSAGYDEMRRIIREVEPPKPSTRLSTLVGEEKNTFTSTHRTDPQKLGSMLKGDLDWIVMKAIEKERGRRYETANAFGLDIQRFLDDEPVSAAAPTAAYMFRKFARRHKGPLAAAAAVVLALLGGLGISLWQAAEAEAAREREATQRELADQRAAQARDEADKSRRFAEFLSEMLQGVEPSVARGRDTTILRELLEETEKKLETEFKDQPEVEAQLRHVIADVYLGLSNYQRADGMIARALELRRELAARPEATQKHQRELAESLTLAWVCDEEVGRYDPKGEKLWEALRVREAAFGESHFEVARSLSNLARFLSDGGEPREAETMARRGLEMVQAASGVSPTERGRVEVYLKQRLASALSDLAKYEESDNVLHDALDQAKDLYGDDQPHTSLLGIRLKLGYNLRQQGRIREAREVHAGTLEAARKLHEGNSNGVSVVLANLASFHREVDELDEAKRFAQEALKMAAEVYGPGNPFALVPMRERLAGILHRRWEIEDAKREIAAVQEALAGFEKLYGRPWSGSPNILLLEARILQSEGDLNGAEKLVTEALRVQELTADTRHPRIADAKARLAWIHSLRGHWTEEEKIRKEVLALRKARQGERHPDTANAHFELGDLMARTSRFLEAQRHHKRALEMRKKIFGAQHPQVALSYKKLGELCRQQQDDKKAKDYFETALEIVRASQPETPGAMKQLIELEVALARTLAVLGQREEAEKLARGALEVHKDLFGEAPWAPTQTVFDFAVVMWELAHYEDAEEAIRTLLARQVAAGMGDPNAANCHDMLGKTLLSAERWDDAKREFQSALNIWRELPGAEANVADSHNALGVLFADQGKGAQALREFQHGFEALPEGHLKGVMMLRNIGFWHGKESSREKAIQSYQKALKAAERYEKEHRFTRHPLRADVHYSYGLTLFNWTPLTDERLEQAREQFEKALEAIKHRDSRAALRGRILANLGATHLRLGDLDQAREQFEAALWVDSLPTEARLNALHNLGQSFLQTDPSEAERHFKKANELIEDENIRNWIAVNVARHLASLTHKDEEVVEWFTLALARGSDSPDGRELLLLGLSGLSLAELQKGGEEASALREEAHRRLREACHDTHGTGWKGLRALLDSHSYQVTTRRAENGGLVVAVVDEEFQDLAGLCEAMRGTPVTGLSLSKTKVTTIAPLAGLQQLRVLTLDGTGVTDLSPLVKIESLEWLQLPKTAEKIEKLRALPKLEYLSFTWDGKNKRPSMTVEQFWAMRALEAGKFEDAQDFFASSFREHLEEGPAQKSTTLTLLRAAKVLALGEDPSIYEELCADAMERFDGESDPAMVEQLCKMLLARPLDLDAEAGERRKDWVQRHLPEKLGANPPKGLPHWFAGTQALTAYREDRFADATAILAERLAGSVKEGNGTLELMRDILRALCEKDPSQLAGLEERYRALHEKHWESSFPARSWNDILMCRILLNDLSD